MTQLNLDQFAAVKPSPINAARPVTGREEAHQIELASLQRLQPGGVVLVNFDSDAFKIVAATLDIEVAGPVAGIAHIGDVLAKAHWANPVRAAANWHVHHHLVKRLGLAVFHTPLPAEYGQTPDTQRQLPVGLAKTIAHRPLIHHLGGGNVFEQRFVRGRGVRSHKRVKTVDDISR